jgi:hypothetical protein
MKADIEKALFFATLLILKTSIGKTQNQDRHFEWGIGLGAYVYQGDLTPDRFGSFRTMKPGVYLFVNKIVNPSLSYRLNLAIASLKGDESKYSQPEFRRQRNFAFNSPAIELSGLGVWDIRGNNFYRIKRSFSPYIFTGAGLAVLNIKPDRSRFNAEFFSTEPEVIAGLATDSQKRLPKLQPFVPAGLGFRYELSDRFAINAEATYRFVFTDYLDGFSHAANPEKDDHYHSLTIGLIYKLGFKNRLNCPPVK